MMDSRFADQVRAHFEAREVASPRLADRVVARLRFEEDRPRHSRRWALSAGAAAVTLLALTPLALKAARTAEPARTSPAGTGPSIVAPGYASTLSLGWFGASGAWVVQRSGSPSVLYQSTDGGAAWHDRLHFSGVYEGMSWVPGGGGGVLWTQDTVTFKLTVYATADGGLTWTPRPKTAWPVEYGYFRGLEGWAISGGPMAGGGAEWLYHTVDAGATWSRLGPAPFAGQRMTSISGAGIWYLQFSDSRHGWFATGQPSRPGDSGLLATSDGGRTWAAQPVAAPPGLAGHDMVIGSPAFVAGGSAILPVMFRARGGPDNATSNLLYVYSSADGGLTWIDPRPMLGSRAGSFQPVGDEWAGFYLDARHWWLSSLSTSAGDNVQAAPAVASTANGGASWTIRAGGPRILQLWFTDPSRGWAEAVTGPQDSNVLLRTTDGGATWRQVTVPFKGA